MTEVQYSKLATALAKAQSVMGGAKKDKKNPFFKSSYADLSSVFDVLREPFAANGLSVTQLMDVLESGRSVMITRLMHLSGEFLESKVMLTDIPDPQKLGAYMTYMRRYCLMAIAGIPAEDDDGNIASAAVKAAAADPVITTEVWRQIDAYVNGHDDLRQELCRLCKITDLKQMKQSQYQIASTYASKFMASREAKENDSKDESPAT